MARDIKIADDKAEQTAVTPFKYSITSYGADYPVDALVKRMNEGDIYIPPFQRGFVWTLPQASGFVESLLLGLPVPGIFLAKDEDTQKMLVIDGQQRLRTLQFFCGGIFGPTRKEFALKDVQNNLMVPHPKCYQRRIAVASMILFFIRRLLGRTSPLMIIVVSIIFLKGSIPVAPSCIRRKSVGVYIKVSLMIC